MISCSKEAFFKYANKDFVMPARTFSEVKGEDNLLIMPCFVDYCIGLKVLTSYPSTKPIVRNTWFSVNKR
jgi:metallophosphoesterase superfamily enzyme